MNGMLSTLWACGKRWLFPRWPWVLFAAAAGAVLLSLVFTCSLEATPLAYAAYLLSFYALVALLGCLARACRPLWRRLNRIPLVARWRQDPYFRFRTGLAGSLCLNLGYAALRIISALAYASLWEGAVGGYHAILCGVLASLLHRMPRFQGAVDAREELRIHRRTGWLLLVLDLALSGVAVQIVQDGRGYDYPGTLIYAMAAYSFLALGLAVVNLVRYRAWRSPVLSAAKAVSLTTALVSLFSLQTAMLAQFGTDPAFAHRMTAITAAAVCGLILATALVLAVAPGNQSISKEEPYHGPYSGRGRR